MAEKDSTSRYSNNYDRILAYLNPASARASMHTALAERLKAEALARKKSFAIRESVSGNPDIEVPALQRELRPGDLVVPLGGDGHSERATNAILGHPDDYSSLSDEVTLACPPGGGFNDNSAVFIHKRNIMQLIASRSTTVTEMTLMQIEVNDEHLMYSWLHFALGGVAVTAEASNRPDVRSRMQAIPSRFKKLFGAVALGATFFKDGLPYTLPEFTHDDEAYDSVGTVMAFNSPVAGAVLRTNEAWHRDPERFLLSVVPDSLPAHAAFMGRALINTVLGSRARVLLPGTPTSEVTLKFDGQDVPAQSGGETFTIADAKTITISKATGKTLRIVDTRRHLSEAA